MLENIHSSKKLPYTLKDFVEICNPEYWRVANECLKYLEAWQELTLKELPKYKKLLAIDEEERKTQEAQNNFSYYFKLRAIYGLAEYLRCEIDKECHELAVCTSVISNDSTCNEQGVETARMTLLTLFNAVNKIDVLDLTKDPASDFQKMDKAFKSYNSFGIIERYTYFDFREPMKTNILDKTLWEAAINCTDPTGVSLGGLMESKEDNEMIMVY